MLATAPTPLPLDMRRALNRVVRRMTIFAVLQGLFWIIIYFGLMLLVRTFADRWLDFPFAMRILLALADLTVIAWLLWKYPLRVFLKRPGPEQAALKIQSKYPDFNSSLITAVQLALRPNQCSPCPPAWKQNLFSAVQKRLTVVQWSKVVPAIGLRNLALGAFGVMAALVLAFFLWGPNMSSVLAARHLGFNVKFPTRTTVQSVTQDLTVERGQSLTLEARAGGVLPSAGTVELRGDDGQKRQFPAVPAPDDPGLFRLVIQNVQQNLSYQFLLGDGTGPEHRIVCQTGPTLVKISVLATPPTYLNQPPFEASPSGLTVPQGTQLVLKLEASTPLAEANFLSDSPDATPLPLQIDPKNPRQAQITFQANDTRMTGFTLPLRAEDGSPSTQDTFYRFQVLPDQPPNVRLLQPEVMAETQTASAVIEIVYSVTDDNRLEEVALCFVEAGFPVQPEALAEGLQVRRISLSLPEPGVPTGVRWVPARENPPPTPGSIITFWIEAADGNTATGPGIGRSETRSFRLVTPEEKLQEVEKRFQEISGDVERLKDLQDEASGQVGRIIGKENPPPSPAP